MDEMWEGEIGGQAKCNRLILSGVCVEIRKKTKKISSQIRLLRAAEKSHSITDSELEEATSIINNLPFVQLGNIELLPIFVVVISISSYKGSVKS